MHFDDQQIILNFLPIISGGGLQNGMSFLMALAEKEEWKDSCIAVVHVLSPIHELCKKLNIKFIAVTGGHCGRLLFELRAHQLFRKGQRCFTIFGPPMLGSINYFININGCAYSNLFYPEIPFWSFKKGFSLQYTRLLDEYRKVLITSADFWIFETEVLRHRSIEICQFPAERVGVVKMAPSLLVSPKKIDKILRKKFDVVMGSGFRILFLNGPHPNKRIDRLPSIAENLIKISNRRFCFVLTLQEEHPYTKRVLSDFARRGLARYVTNIGPIPQGSVPSLIDCVDALGTFSHLESFSNNFVEAWAMGKALIVTAADWAEVACGDGAVYVDPDEPAGTAGKIAELINDTTMQGEIIARGMEQIAQYPTAHEKLEHYWSYIERAAVLGNCSKTIRKQIYWPKNVLFR